MASNTRFPHNSSARLLRTIGDQLLNRQQKNGGWTFALGHPELIGLSHGASGVAVALAEISVSLGDSSYADAAARGLDYEASLFNPSQDNWPDLRIGLSPADRFSMNSWCHGSVGIALARIRMLELCGTHDAADTWRHELSVAIESAINLPLTPVDHLCCGNLGRAAIISLAGQFNDDLRWQSIGRDLTSDVFDAAKGDAGSIKLLLGIEGSSGLRLPGLMTGLSGIGMVLLHGQDFRWINSLLV